MSTARAATGSAARRRLALRITGTVQGVGFRPFVFRLAEDLDLSGWVRNDEHGVEVEVEGLGWALDEFVERLADEAPALASIRSLETRELSPLGERGFAITRSRRRGEADAAVAPDAATCAACLEELFDPADRRHRYPFINCTDCGPRFTIVSGVPYDRPQTTMADFEMCERCRREYEDPRDRRFHAQPNACPVCGPRVRLVDASGELLAGARAGAPADDRSDPVAAAAELLTAGRILAVKGIGGYHLACLAEDEDAVARLRSRKRREQRPFALIAPDLGGARALVELSPAEETLLCGRERPIVIAPRRPGADVAAAVAPRSAELGVMLPYSPLHHLLLADVGRPLVMTSGNVSDEPIAYRDEDAFERLGAIVDALLVHDRPIHTRTDDSVVRSLGPLRAEPLLLRRSRGFAPAPLPLPIDAGRGILACGAEQKNTFCLARGRTAWVGQHIGDLKNFETLSSLGEGIEHFEHLFGVEPGLVVHDLHPDYLATRYALEREGAEQLAVQHHHAHFAACLAEHGELGAAVGAVYDGTGLGSDGTIWGGEILRGQIAAAERGGFLFPVRMPGGEAAIREPWRMACAWLVAALDEGLPTIPPALRRVVDERRWEAVCELIHSGVNSPITTSAGRLFDAVAAICGVGPTATYEGQAAIELEAASARASVEPYELGLIEAGEGAEVMRMLDARETVRALILDLAKGADVATAGARFHAALAAATAAALTREAEAAATGTIVLSGGVFCNRLLLERTVAPLRAAGLTVLLPLRLPANDGGIAFGQVAVAAAQRGAGR